MLPALIRGAILLAFWVVLIGTDVADLVAGFITAAIATWVSLWLLPPVRARVRLIALPVLIARFAWQSVIAGWDVARRALDPKLPLAPGFVDYRCDFPPGIGRNAFASLTSLLPGTVPIADDGKMLRYHCLDVNQPVAAQLGTEEALLARAFEGKDE